MVKRRVRQKRANGKPDWDVGCGVEVGGRSHEGSQRFLGGIGLARIWRIHPSVAKKRCRRGVPTTPLTAGRSGYRPTTRRRPAHNEIDHPMGISEMGI